ncbi:MAG: GNAT family N-acetyltransferase [Candidatus Hydrogenedentota bacterium]
MADIPKNMDNFVREIAPEYLELFGPIAETEYRREIIERMDGASHHPSVRIYCAMVDNRAVGMLQWFSEDRVAHITFLHVLAGHSHHDAEDALLGRALTDIGDSGHTECVCDAILFGETDVRDAFHRAGFRRIPRALLSRECSDAIEGKTSSGIVTPLSVTQRPLAASLIVRVYADHPDRALHRDLADATRAQRFLDNVASGAYGAADDATLIGIADRGELVGVLVGCESPAGVGFILQVAVDPARQYQGYGRALIGHFARHCSRRGLDRLALGVTLGNPAERLYARLGFRRIREVDVFVRP